MRLSKAIVKIMYGSQRWMLRAAGSESGSGSLSVVRHVTEDELSSSVMSGEGDDVEWDDDVVHRDGKEEAEEEDDDDDDVKIVLFTRCRRRRALVVGANAATNI